MRDAGTAVVAGQLELPEAELLHQAYLVAGHGPLGIDESGGVWSGLAGAAVSAQVGQNDGVVLGEVGGDVAPGEVVLRIPVQQQKRWARPIDCTADGDVLDVHTPVLYSKPAAAERMPPSRRLV